MYEKASAFDRIYRSLLLTKFFTRGWGNPSTIKRQFDFLRVLADRSSCQHLVNKHYPVNIDKDVEKGEVRIVDGHFRSPFDRYLPNVMPKEVKTARFQLIVPTKWPTHRKPVCIHMAGTGDHYFWRRRTLLARPLIKEYGIGSLLLENPFYGVRKPKEQLRSSLRHVNDLFVMGGGLILEGLVMLHWCEKHGFGPLGLTGISMGGHMASLAATNWHKPIPLIPCLSWSSATPAFTEGVLSGSIPWPVLVTQYMGQHLEYEREIMKELQKCPKTDSFRLGQNFVWNYPESLDDLKGMQQNNNTSPQVSHPKDLDSIPCNKERTISNSSNNTTESPMKKSVLEQRNAMSETSSQCDGQEDSKRAIEMWPIGKLDLQGAVAESFKGSKEFKAGPAMKSNIKDKVSCTCDSQTTDHTLQGNMCDGLPNPKSDLNVQYATAEVNTDNSSASDKRNSTAHDRFSASSDDAIKNKESGERSSDAKEKKKKRKPTKITDMENYQELKKQALEFMRGVMDVTTYVGNFSTPVDTDLVIVVSALKDGYIPRRGVPGLDDIWPGVEVRYIEGGHVAAFLFKQAEFRKAINDGFNKYLIKYENESIATKSESSKTDVKS